MIIKIARIAVTLIMAAIAISLTAGLWQHYMTAPWTRDGRVHAEVVEIAPEVAGTVASVDIRDNQSVKKGDILFQIDPTRFQLAVAQAKAELDQRQRELGIRSSDVHRRSSLADVIAAEEIDRFKGSAGVAAAAVNAARAALDIAQLNLDRTVLRAPVDGYVINLHLRVGDYVSTGQPRITLLDKESFWIAGYFDETKLKSIHMGDAAMVTLMGYPTPLAAHVDSFGRGISDPNSRPDGLGLPDVNPIFSWVRLAQRIPVRLRLDTIPADIQLVAGMTCSINVLPPAN